MVKFNIEMNGIEWEVTGDESSQEYLDKNYEKINKFMDDLDSLITKIRAIEFMLKSESLQLKIVGEELDNVDFFFYQENLGADKSTEVFYQMIIDKKNRLVGELKNTLKQMTYNGYIINYSQSVVNMINRIWQIDQNYFLKSYLIAEEC